MSAALRGHQRASSYATAAQITYLHRLQKECARYRCGPYPIDWSRAMLRSDASRSIDDFKRALDEAKAESERKARLRSYGAPGR